MNSLAAFIEKRKHNFRYLMERLTALDKFPILPKATPSRDPSLLGFFITICEESGITRVDLMKYLDQYKIGNLLLFAVNTMHQPYFKGKPYRISGELSNTDAVMNSTFMVGVYPGHAEPMLDFFADKLETFMGVSIK